MIWVAFCLVALLVSCSPSPLSILTGGGPKVAANGQAGRTNAQTVGQAVVTDQRIDAPQAQRVEQSAGNTRVRADQVERVTVNETPPWVIIFALIGWLLPSPGEIARKVRGLFKRRAANAD